MSINRFVAISLAMAITCPGIASAHPGHGQTGDGNSLLHYATSPLHILPVFGAAILISVPMFILSLRNRLIQAKKQR